MYNIKQDSSQTHIVQKELFKKKKKFSHGMNKSKLRVHDDVIYYYPTLIKCMCVMCIEVEEPAEVSE